MILKIIYRILQCAFVGSFMVKHAINRVLGIHLDFKCLDGARYHTQTHLVFFFFFIGGGFRELNFLPIKTPLAPTTTLPCRG